jgi:hypothetical protein
MKLYLFSPIEKKYREEFDQHIKLQNIGVTAFIALSVALITITVRIMSWIIPYQEMISPRQFSEYRLLNNFMPGSSFLFAGLLFSSEESRSKTAKSIPLSQYAVYAFIYRQLYIPHFCSAAQPEKYDDDAVAWATHCGCAAGIFCPRSFAGSRFHHCCLYVIFPPVPRCC